MAVVDGHYDKRVRLSGNDTAQLAKNILAFIAQFVSKEQLTENGESDESLDHLIVMMQDFRKNCKKRKQIALNE